LENLKQFYNSRIDELSKQLDRVKRHILLTGILRFAVFVVGVAILWTCRDSGWMALICVVIAFAAPFTALIVSHSRLFRQKEYAETMRQLNQDELRALDYDFSAFDGAAEAVNAEHAFCADLDLFGQQSLFQSMNRTVTYAGKAMLVNWLSQPMKIKNDILKRQETVREMATKTAFRQDFYVTGKACGEASMDDLQQLRLLAKRTTMFSNSLLIKVLIWAVPAMWIFVTAGVLFMGIPYSVLGFALVIALIISNIHSKRINSFHTAADKIDKTLGIYSQLIEKIENEIFTADELLDAQRAFLPANGFGADASGSRKTSMRIRQLSYITGSLDQRFSMAGLIFNILYMRDMRMAMRMEKWIADNSPSFDAWFGALARIDAICSSGGFAFNHPDYIFPAIEDGYFHLEGKALGHPLLHRDVCVRNDVSIPQNSYFLIITGANMAGKSTYLRTVAINYVLACSGVPVCAESMTLTPAGLFTSLRTADSLTANESYFFAELKRLKMLIDRLQEGERLFVILDEILKGTNSRDKQQGSLALMKQLIRLQTCGIIATHDLALSALEQSFPDNTRNCCFEADIQGDNLTFDYRLRPGVAQNMNASFLMKRMGITG